MDVKRRGDLRDLAKQIEITAQNHFCYSQVASVVRNAVDHICAIARIEEMNRVLPPPLKPEIRVGVRVFCRGARPRGLVTHRIENVCIVHYDCSHFPEMRRIQDLEAL